jgi:hypothetical protein
MVLVNVSAHFLFLYDEPVQIERKVLHTVNATTPQLFQVLANATIDPVCAPSKNSKTTKKNKEQTGQIPPNDLTYHRLNPPQLPQHREHHEPACGGPPPSLSFHKKMFAVTPAQFPSLFIATRPRSSNPAISKKYI